jgi:hypothetical protein
MPEQQHSKATIVSMAVVAAGLTVLLHEGLGHGATAWLRGDTPIELTSNHLASLRPDKWVDAGGTLVNLAVGAMALTAAQVGGNRPNLRYFWWILAAKNLFSGAGYFMFSGVSGFGDWAEVIRGWPHQGAWRVGMTIFGALLYLVIARLLAVEIRPFCVQRRMYNVVGRLPYLAGCSLSVAAGLLDPMGLKLLLVSTIPAAFGGPSGLLWLDALMPRTPVEHELVVRKQPVWWIVATAFAVAYVALIGRGIRFSGQ